MTTFFDKFFSSLAIVALSLILVVPAFATYPGKNGRIAFVIVPDIYTMNSDGSDLKQLTHVAQGDDTFYPSWSIDGRQIVFNHYFSDKAPQLWLMNADGSNQRTLVADPAFALMMPSFTPDGKSVIFSRCRTDFEECNIAQVVIDTGEITFITPILTGIVDQFPKYSPDGKSITFAALGREGVVLAIYRLDLGSANPVRLTPPALTGHYADWSPDGSKIAFCSHQLYPQFSSEDQHNGEIIQVDPGGGNLTRLTFNDGGDFFNEPYDFQPSWSPQGDAIVFERDTPDFFVAAIYLLKMDGSAPAKILAVPGSRSRAQSQPFQRGLRANPSFQRLNQGLGPSWGPAQQ